MQKRNNQTSNVGQMIQRCHKWRQKRKQYIDNARQISDDVERERMLQQAEHYGRMVNSEQGKIDGVRGPVEKISDDVSDTDDEENGFPDFINGL